MSSWYAKFEHFAFQGTVTCCTMVDSHNKKRVLEVGCGPGFHSEQIAKSWINPDHSLLVSCDFSKEMVTLMKKRYETSEFSKREGVFVQIDAETDFTASETSQIELPNEIIEGK